MSTQKQEEQRFDAFAEEEESVSRPHTAKRTVKKETKQPAKNRKYYMRLFWSLLAVTLLGYGVRAGYRNSTLFLEHTEKEGYLPVDEYVLYRDGEPLENVRSLRFDGDYIWYGDEDGKETSRGISAGDSWQDFVEAYGDCHYDYLYWQEKTVGSDGVTHYSDSQYAPDGLTVREFDERFVQTGEVDIAKHEIGVNFSVEYVGNELMYSQKDQYDSLDRVYTTWNDLNHSYPRQGSFDLRFTFIPAGIDRDMPEGGLEYVSSSNYSY
ncbi:MAG: hypothetical protein IJ130_05540 [Solobacterium sp.]|nr:hypothetical protein [Solobacterium sp.]